MHLIVVMKTLTFKRSPLSELVVAGIAKLLSAVRNSLSGSFLVVFWPDLAVMCNVFLGYFCHLVTDESISDYLLMPCLTFLRSTSCLAPDCEDLSPFTPMTDEDSVVFSKLTYLGCASVNAPRSEVEALRMMSILRSQCQISLDVTLSVPNVSEGTVRYDAHLRVFSDCVYLILIIFSRENKLPVCLGGVTSNLGFCLLENVGFKEILRKVLF